MIANHRPARAIDSKGLPLSELLAGSPERVEREEAVW